MSLCGSPDVLEVAWPQVCGSDWEILVVTLGKGIASSWSLLDRWYSGWAQRRLWALHVYGVSLEGAGSSWGQTKPIMHLCDQASQALEAVLL